MDEEQQAVNETPEVPEVVDSPTTEETTGGQEPSSEVTQVKPVEKRIHKLVDERDEAVSEAARVKAVNESLARQVEELTTIMGGNNGSYPDIQTIEPGAEVTSEQYKADVVRTAQSIAQLEVAKAKMLDTINRESTDAMRDHPELDPNSDVFDRELSDTITDSVRAQIQTNPTASVKKLVDSLMKPYRKSVDKQVAENTKELAKQASETALRPSQVKGVEKAFEDLTPAEMEQRLGTVW